MSKDHRKPTGKLNLYQVSPDGIKEIPSVFPETKEEQEINVASLFLQLINKNSTHQLPYQTFTKNSEQDFDFTLHNNGQQSFLELTELVPSDNMKGGYSDASPNVHQGKLVERLIRIIEKKSKNYKGNSTPIDLLVYVTDDNSNISPTGEEYLKTYLNLNSHVFRSIFYFVPFFQNNDGIILKYYPNEVTSKTLPLFPSMALNLKLKPSIKSGRIGSNLTPPKKRRKY